MTRDVRRIVVERMTPERREQLRRALERADEIRRQLLAERGGRLFCPSNEDVRAERERREW